jgi:threonine dehydrogenase-like Zn-dependent dehydrogenase
MHLGTVRGLPGGFAEVIYAHPSQLHPLPAGLDPRLAVLADPLAVGLHALERAGDEPKGPVLVLGAGTIGLGLGLAARQRWPGAKVYVTAAWEHQHSFIGEAGASPLTAAPTAVVEEMAAVSGGRLVRPWRGGAFAIGGGAELVLDSIGSAATTDLGLRALAPGGRIVTVGVGRPQRVERTLSYYKEAHTVGSNGYGVSELMAGRPHLLDVALDLLAARPGPMARWLTHSFPLSQWRQAFAAAARPDRSGAIKVSLELSREDQI